MVPGSTLMYGSSLMLVTRMPRDSRIAAREAAAMPFPREETTPPVTKTYFVIYPRRVGMQESTGSSSDPQTRRAFGRGGFIVSAVGKRQLPRRYGLRRGTLVVVLSKLRPPPMRLGGNGGAPGSLAR